MTVKRMNTAEFRSEGFLQEVNRRFLHPCGLALEVDVMEDGTEVLGGVWDYRDDPEGIVFGTFDREKVAKVDAELERHEKARIALLGDVVQNRDLP